MLLFLSACATNYASGREDRAVSSYSDETFLALLDRYVVDDSVDYGAWHASAEDMAALDRQVAMIAKVSPNSHPGLFSDKTSQNRYWINSYNALVVDAVLDYWPLESVKDVKLSLTSRLIPGKGFFYDRDVVVGGRKTNLLKLEKSFLRSQLDPRLHFALNCASGSCPALKSSDWSEEELVKVSREFVNNPKNVRVEASSVYLNKIFDWYKKEFPRDLYGHLAQFAEPKLAAQLQQASAGGYKRRFREYDWTLNDGSDADILPASDR
jgi:hypothetical protein